MTLDYNYFRHAVIGLHDYICLVGKRSVFPINLCIFSLDAMFFILDKFLPIVWNLFYNLKASLVISAWLCCFVMYLFNLLSVTTQPIKSRSDCNVLHFLPLLWRMILMFDSIFLLFNGKILFSFLQFSSSN
jgi:hypothetical protein